MLSGLLEFFGIKCYHQNYGWPRIDKETGEQYVQCLDACGKRVPYSRIKFKAKEQFVA